MSDILLVHGSGHGAWCWRDVVPALEAMGHKVQAIDMPSHGDDATAVSEVTLESCAEAVVAAIHQESIVVGHSWAGFPISRAADLAPDQIARLIFVCAYVPQGGLSLVDMRKLAPRQPLMKAVVRSSDGLSYVIDPDQTVDVFYHDCPKGTVEYANARLCPQAIAPQVTPLSLGQGFATVAKSYIRCTDDRTIPPEFQTEMTQVWSRQDVFDMHCGHSPFFADPDGLAARIDRISRG